MKKSIFFALFISLFSCKKDSKQMPLTKEKMVDVLVDINIAEGVIDPETMTVKDSVAKIYYRQIFEHHGITAKLYDSSFSNMSNDPELMHSVYDDVSIRIKKMRKELQQDSIIKK